MNYQNQPKKILIRFALHIAIVLFCCSWGICKQQTTLKGVVTNENGTPLPSVYVYFSIHGGVETNADGQFQITKGGRVVVFVLGGYKTVVKVLEEQTETIEVILEKGINPGRELKICSEKNGEKKNFGILHLNIPPAINLSNGRDIDYEDFYISYKNEKREVMTGMVGHLVSRGLPGDELVLSSSTYTISFLTFGSSWLFDMKGQNKNGKYWRWVGSSSFIKYVNVSKEAADFFDKLIDEGCY